MKTEFSGFVSKLKRKPDSNKYDYGHILVVAGSKNTPGAGVLCSNGAMRAGAGLVTYACEENFLTQAASMSKPEIMFFVYKTAADIIDFANSRKVSAMTIGPGLCLSSRLNSFIDEIISSVDMPVVLDASALSAYEGKAKKLKNVKAKLILTPHAGEFRKLLPKPCHSGLVNIPNSSNEPAPYGLNTGESILEHRRDIITTNVDTGFHRYDKLEKINAVKNFAKQNSLTCLLKGHNTIVSDGKREYVNKSGTPAMATAGSGDVLSGIISAFCTRGFNPFEAAKFGAYVHGLAGELAEKEKGENGVTASDICEKIPYVLNKMCGCVDA